MVAVVMMFMCQTTIQPNYNSYITVTHYFNYQKQNKENFNDKNKNKKKCLKD